MNADLIYSPPSSNTGRNSRLVFKKLKNISTVKSKTGIIISVLDHVPDPDLSMRK
jgi:hypothetical protein